MSSPSENASSPFPFISFRTTSGLVQNPRLKLILFVRELAGQVLLGNTARRNGEGLGLAPAGDSLKAATAELRALAESGRSVGWFLRLASVAVSLLREGEDKGLTRAALKRAAEMIAPDPHAQALRALSVTQVCTAKSKRLFRYTGLQGLSGLDVSFDCACFGKRILVDFCGS